MKKVLSTAIVLSLFAGVASAAVDPFHDPSQALPRSTGYEQALPRVSNDDHRQALPRVSDDDYRDALPFTQDTFPDVTIATP